MSTFPSYNTTRDFISSRKGEVLRTLSDMLSLPDASLLRSTLTSQMNTQSTGHRPGKAVGARRQLEADRISDHRCPVQQACVQQPSTAACCSICSRLILFLCCLPAVHHLCHLCLDWGSSACRRQIVSHACAPPIYSSRLHICAGVCPDQWQAAERGSAIQSRQWPAQHPQAARRRAAPAAAPSKCGRCPGKGGPCPAGPGSASCCCALSAGASLLSSAPSRLLAAAQGFRVPSTQQGGHLADWLRLHKLLPFLRQVLLGLTGLPHRHAAQRVEPLGTV